ncbi:MAG: molecular chaperone HtpG [Firmicutes bacterium]|nr:molecular chaperone HtpG [Bacillota bacterium]
MKEFKAESKRLLELMINSIYTNKEIFLRELISNASDSLDKRKFLSLTNDKATTDFEIIISLDKTARTLTIRDSGIGMDEKDLEENLSTIAKSGTLAFKKKLQEDNKKDGKSDENNSGLIGQFGVGFYSAFMVAKKIEVISKKFGTKETFLWTSHGVDGYEIAPVATSSKINSMLLDKSGGIAIVLTLHEDDDDFRYSQFLNEDTIEELIKKYSDYIRYPIRFEQELAVEVEIIKEDIGTDDSADTKSKTSASKKGAKTPKTSKTRELKTLNSMIPIWKKPKSKVKDEELNSFYMSEFGDLNPPLKHIFASLEGTVSYSTLLFIPSRFSDEFMRGEKISYGLKLYSEGVLVMEKCSDVLPEYLSFVKGLVDSSDLPLNISREILQHTKHLKLISRSLEKKILDEFKKTLENNREQYEKIFNEFGTALKFGTYEHFGIRKDNLKDLLLFNSSNSDNLTSLKEYIERAGVSQEYIYYAVGENAEKIKKSVHCAAVLERGYEVLFLHDKIDEFVMKVLMEYGEKKFLPVTSPDAVELSNDEKDELMKEEDTAKELLTFVKTHLKGKVFDVRLSTKILDHATSLTSEGEITIEMEKVLGAVPAPNPMMKAPKAKKILLINPNHSVFSKMQQALKDDHSTLKNYADLLLSLAMLGVGLPVDGTELSELVQKTI